MLVIFEEKNHIKIINRKRIMRSSTEERGVRTNS